MRLYRVRIATREFAMMGDIRPTCVVKMKKPKPKLLRRMLLEAFKDSQGLTMLIQSGKYDAEEINLKTEGVV